MHCLRSGFLTSKISAKCASSWSVGLAGVGAGLVEGGEQGAHLLIVRTYGANAWATALIDIVGVKAPTP